MRILRQLTSFSIVGISATLIHVAVAAILIDLSVAPPMIANLAGAVSAYFVSFLGNAFFTFGFPQKLAVAARRYLLVSTASALLTSAILFATQAMNLPILAYYLLVVTTVPPITFILAKYWALRRDGDGYHHS